MPRDWTKNADKRDAARDFLQEIVNNAGLRQRIVKSGEDDRAFARSEFARIGQINIPSDVEVICLEPDRDHLNNLVVFKLPLPGAAPINPLEHWIAAWVPYGPGKAPAAQGG